MNNLLLQYSQYNIWANTKMCGFIRQSGEAILDKEISSSFNSIRKTIQHIWNVETVWLRRLKGESALWSPHPDFKGKFEQMELLVLHQSQLLVNYTGTCDEKKLNEDFNYKDSKGNSWTNKRMEALMHCFNHSTYHRGQLVTMLRNAGFIQLGSTDLITYFREKN